MAIFATLQRLETDFKLLLKSSVIQKLRRNLTILKERVKTYGLATIRLITSGTFVLLLSRPYSWAAGVLPPSTPSINALSVNGLSYRSVIGGIEERIQICTNG